MTTLLSLATSHSDKVINEIRGLGTIDLSDLSPIKVNILARLIEHLDHEARLTRFDLSGGTKRLAGFATTLSGIDLTSDDCVVQRLGAWALDPFIYEEPESWRVPGLLANWTRSITVTPTASDWRYQLAEGIRSKVGSPKRATLGYLVHSLGGDFLRHLCVELTGSSAIDDDSIDSMSSALEAGLSDIGNRYPSTFTAISFRHILTQRVLDGASPTSLLPALDLGFRQGKSRLWIMDATLRDWVATPEAPLEWFIALHGDWFEE